MPFRDITDHRQLPAPLGRSVSRGTLPSSLIFAGPPGSGKRATAVALAQALNCLEPQTTAHTSRDACGRCSACRRIARGVHPDVLTVEPGDNGSIRIDQVRDVVERAGYRPFEGHRRVVIIDEAGALVAPATASSWRRTCAQWRRCFATWKFWQPVRTSAQSRALAPGPPPNGSP